MRRFLEKGWQGVLPPSYTKARYYKDADGDGYGDNNESLLAYFKPDGYTAKGGDCDDNNKEIYPGSTKSCTLITLNSFPNPSTGRVIVTYNSKSACRIAIKVYDQAGRVVFSKTDQATAGSNSYQLNLYNLKSGAYDLELSDGILPQRTKLLIQK